MVKKIKIILDTNFLLTMVRNRIFGLEQITKKIPVEFFVLTGVLFELQGLGKENKKLKKESELVKKILEINKVKTIESKKKWVDDELVELSKEYVIATNDKKLREKIHKKKGKTVFIRSLTYVDTSEILEE